MLALASVLVVGAQAPAAAAATWKVVNPNADGSFTAVTPSLTVKNAAGQSLFKCTNLGVKGSLPSGSSPAGKFTTNTVSDCTGHDGSPGKMLVLTPLADNYLSAQSFNASTGTTTFVHRSTGTVYSGGVFTATAPGCSFFVSSIATTYTNATSVLKSTTAKAYPLNEQDGTVSCPGLLTAGETITFAAEYKVTPAIKITATTT